MKLEVVLRPQAESDLTIAFRWYEERNPGLGFEFRQAIVVLACLHVRRDPAICPSGARA